MPQPPAAIIVVRHGARLDAADRNWHLSSPAPYDPPLTYGGWNQSKALGSRIASILNTRASTFAPVLGSDDVQIYDFDGLSHTSNGSPAKAPKKRKQKVVIHSSPFLRCLQTSVAIGAGMAQSAEAPGLRQRRRSSSKQPKVEFRINSPTIPELEEDEFIVKALNEDGSDQEDVKTVLRVDAFLGEWLSPDYFDSITPPPNSTMMVAAAKANLLRREQIEVFQPSTAGAGYFPGGWSKNTLSREDPTSSTSAFADDDSLFNYRSLLAPQIPHKHRASSHSSTGSSGQIGPKPVTSSLATSRPGYNPPIPAYAIAPSDPIPRGYCVHARDACTDIDLHWDSMRQPQDWGDGGEYGEEWSAMHKRFRGGLFKMISWYKEHSPEFHPDIEDPLTLKDDNHENDDEYELILVLVTHGAGCNALIGALTNQPVLRDFGLASLSMAVRKESNHVSSANGHNVTQPPSRRRSSVDFGLSEEYEVQIVASSDHLRAGAEATRASALQSPHLVAHIPEFRGREHIHSPSGKSYGDFSSTEPRRSISSALGSIRRSSLTPTSSYRNSSLSPSRSATSGSSSGGLWSKAPTTPSSIDDIQYLSIGSPAVTRPGSSDSDKPLPTGVQQLREHREDEPRPLPSSLGRAMSQHGLWGVQPSSARRGRDVAPKRRWTVNEQDP